MTSYQRRKSHTLRLLSVVAGRESLVASRYLKVVVCICTLRAVIHTAILVWRLATSDGRLATYGHLLGVYDTLSDISLETSDWGSVR